MILQPVRAVSFDVNGTLIHAPRLGAIYAEVLGRHGIRVESERVREVVHVVWQEFSCAGRLGEDRFATHPDGCRGWWYRFVDRVCEHLGEGPASPFAKAELFRCFTGPEAWQVYEEVPTVLEEVRASGVRMAVLSNWDDRLPMLLWGLELAHFFESIVYSAAVGAEKPHPSIFEQVLEDLGLPPEEVVHVGDRQREDIEGARALGMQTLHITRQGDGGELDSLRSLVDLLRPH